MNLTPEERALLQSITRSGSRELFTAERFLFDKQRAVWEDPSRFVTVDCTRRAGKTDLAAFALHHAAKSKPRAIALYVMETGVDARDTLWGRFKELNEQYHLGWELNETTMTAHHAPNNGEIRLRGAKDAGQAQRLRGSGYELAIADEAQNQSASLKTLITDALLPAMLRRGGTGRIWVMGTPSLVPVGYWFDLVHEPDSIWSHHRWSMRDNPWLENVEMLMREAARALGGEDAASYRREWLGQWVADLNSLVFQFDPRRNLYSELPKGRMETVLGVDFGHFPDASAIACWGWFPEIDDTLYLVEEWVLKEQDIDDVAAELERFIEQYEPRRVVADEGALGKMIAATLRRRKGLPVQPAEKQDKPGAINVFNSDLRKGRIRVRRGDLAAHDMGVLRWDEKAKEAGKLRIADKPHSDVMDASLYAHRAALHFRLDIPPPKPANEAESLEEQRLALLDRLGGDSWDEADARRMGF